MRFRTSDIAAILVSLVSFATACGGGGDETHGIGDSGKGGKGGKGAGGSVPVGGSGGTAGSAGTVPVGGSGGASAGTGTGGSEDCAKSTSMASPEAPVLLFLVDTSQSMTQTAPGGTDSKWVVTRNALTDAFTSMRDGTNVGLVFFPDVPTGAMPCFDSAIDVPIAALDAAQRMQLGMQLMGQNPSGSTPTHDGYAYAIEQLNASTLRGQKYVVLITDGEPTYALGCMGTGQPGQMPPTPTEPLIQAAAAALADNDIRTFVIGSPGSEAALMSLSQMASQGGTARAGCSDTGPTYCHLDMTTEPNFSTALNAALDQVISGIPLTCDFPLPAPPAGETIDLGKVNVTYNPGMGTAMPIGRDASLEGLQCNNGWQYTTDHSAITLCGDLCDQVKADPMASVTIQLGCSTIIEPP